MEGPVYYETPHRFYDERGFFQELFNGPRIGHPLPEEMAQVNHSHSKKGVLRGMHWQKPNPVGKYITCLWTHTGCRGGHQEIQSDIQRVERL